MDFDPQAAETEVVAGANTVGANVYTLRVFVDESGNFGNLVSVVMDEGRQLDHEQRLAMARQFEHGEMVFVNSLAGADVSIFNSQQEIQFAGHAMVGTAWLLAGLSARPIDIVRSQGGAIYTWQDGDLVWVRAGLTMLPPWQFKQFDSPLAVEAITLEEAKAMEHTLAWAWLDDYEGTVRARTFASDWNIPETEANGSGAMLLAAALKRQLKIVHGKGSVIYAKSALGGAASLGGRVVGERVSG